MKPTNPSGDRTPSYSAATLHEAAGRIGALPARLKPSFAGAQIAGPAFPVVCAVGDNLWLHRAVYAAAPGDVLVVAPTDDDEFGYWGEILSEAAVARGLGGLVIDGGVRDTAMLGDVGLPVFSSVISIRGTVKNPASAGGLPSDIVIGDIQIHHGDLIVGDADGVVCIPRDDVETVFAAAAEREAKEAGFIAALRAGESTLDLFGLR